MEELKEKIKNLYLELAYVRLEWNLLKEIDEKTKRRFYNSATRINVMP